MNDIILECKNLNFFYGKKQILKNINLGIKRNAVTSIIGPSGCGKTTFLRCLNRMHDLYPHSKYEGEIVIDGRNILDNKIDLTELRQKVGMVFQKPTPFFMSIYENIAFGLRIKGIKSKDELNFRIEKALKDSALWDEVKDILHSPATKLSGGQQQRLCIARAIAVEPEILLLDEPCSALDPASTIRIEDLIAKLKKNYTIVIVTHNMQQAARVSDYTGFFLNGELVEFDTTHKIFTAPTSKLTEEYVTGRFG